MIIVTDEYGEILYYNEHVKKEDVIEELRYEYAYWIDDMEHMPQFQKELKEHEKYRRYFDGKTITYEVYTDIPIISDEQLASLEMQSNIDYLACLAELYIQ